MIGRRALAIVLAIPAACAPPAQTVGGWSTGEASSSTAAATTTSAETSSASTSSESSGAGTSSDSSESSSSAGTTGVAAVPPWIATIAEDVPPRLQVVDLDDGDVIDVCALADVVAPDALAWLADGRLVGSRAAGSELWLADPCDCTVTPVAGLEPAVALHAVTELDDGSDLVIGADTKRAALIVVRLSVPEVVTAIDFADVGSIAALTRRGEELLALAPAELWHVDASDGSVTQSVPVALAAVATGATISPIDGAMLVCDDDGALWRVDPDDGTVAPLGLVLPGACRALATATAAVACIEGLLLE